MTFAKKIFIAVFLVGLTLGTGLIWGAYQYTTNRTENDFISRYSVFTKILADTLSRLDTNTESLMLNAAKVIAEKDAKYGLLSNEKLRSLQNELGITHLFVTDQSGKFIRSTNDDPASIPNIFSFCDNYKKLITGHLQVEATPIIKPNPEPKPFKFLSIPNLERSRIIEVGVRVDFIAKTLAEAVQSDKNVRSMSLYAPDGTSFGTFSENNVAFEDKTVELPSNFDNPVVSDDAIHFFTKVVSSHPRCCQCDKAGTSRNGEYYYVLESRVSKNELKNIQANAGIIFLIVGLSNGLFSYIIARFLSKRLVRNIEIAVERVRKIKNQGDVTERIGIDTKDEISFLTGEFDRLLDSLENSQNKLIEAEKVKSKVELARTVAHNIKSPVLAIEMMIPGLTTVPDRIKRVFKNSVKEIKELADKLKNNSDVMTEDMQIEIDTDLVFLPIFLDDLIRQKEIEFSDRSNSSIRLIQPHSLNGLFVKASSLELKSILSNLINNASESYGPKGGYLEVHLQADTATCIILIKDQGSGIPQEYLAKLGSRNISFKGSKGRGLGLKHAFDTLGAWGGKIEIQSEVSQGTEIIMRLPKYSCDTLEQSRGNLISI